MTIDIAAPGVNTAGLRTALQSLLLTTVVSFKDFGAVGNGSTNNAAALNAFSTYAVAESAAGRGVVLHVAPGVYLYDHSQCQSWLYNIRRLHMRGYGAVFRNTYD
ncbi:MAG: hypothetical protein M3R04_07810, partial [bacterium]|nr:hypothetical protein [bacterium]